jgi:hypothetical protein
MSYALPKLKFEIKTPGLFVELLGFNEFVKNPARKSTLA